jgi:hypothetical protein
MPMAAPRYNNPESWNALNSRSRSLLTGVAAPKSAAERNARSET